MTINTIRDHLTRRPFAPFRVVMSSGESYVVRHPENAILLRGGLAVAYGSRNGDLPESVATLSFLHITAIDPLPSRGSARRR